MKGKLDYCPICAMDLKDDKRETRLEHDKMYHPDYFTLQTGIKKSDW